MLLPGSLSYFCSHLVENRPDLGQTFYAGCYWTGSRRSFFRTKQSAISAGGVGAGIGTVADAVILLGDSVDVWHL